MIDEKVVAVIEAIINNGGIAEIKVEGDQIVVVEIGRKVKDLYGITPFKIALREQRINKRTNKWWEITQKSAQIKTVGDHR